MQAVPGNGHISRTGFVWSCNLQLRLTYSTDLLAKPRFQSELAQTFVIFELEPFLCVIYKLRANRFREFISVKIDLIDNVSATNFAFIIRCWWRRTDSKTRNKKLFSQLSSEKRHYCIMSPKKLSILYFLLGLRNSLIYTLLKSALLPIKPFTVPLKTTQSLRWFV